MNGASLVLVRFSVLCLVFLGLLFKLYNLFGVKLCKRNCELQLSVPLGSPCLVGCLVWEKLVL